jgi:predicted DNA-binding transcriptional regulator YafY
MMSRAARLFKITELIESSSYHNAASLAMECGVSERTMYRDLSELSQIGIPVYFGEKGYQIDKSRLPLKLELSLEEIIALKAASSSSSKVPIFGDELRSAVTKILESLFEGRNVSAQGLEVVHFPKAHVKDEKKVRQIFSRLEKAIHLRRRVIFHYQSIRRDAPVLRKLDPYVLVFRRHCWYLLGHCHLRKDIRLFRLERISDLVETEERFLYPRDFSLEDYFSSSWEVYQGEPCRVRIRFSSKVAPIFKASRHHQSEMIEELPEGDIIYTVEVKGTTEIMRWVLGFGEDAEVLQPEELRKRIKKLASRLLALYRND